MNPALAERLRYLCDVVEQEVQHLQATDQRLFARAFTVERVVALGNNLEEAERVDAFVARFGRLQDTTGDKLLPALLRYVGQTPGPALDNLHLAEKWGWVSDAQSWMNARQLRNQMVHEYIKDAAVLCDALNTGHDLVPLLTGTAQTLLIEARNRLPA